MSLNSRLVMLSKSLVIGSIVHGRIPAHSWMTGMDGGSVDYAGVIIDGMYARSVVTDDMRRELLGHDISGGISFR